MIIMKPIRENNGAIAGHSNVRRKASAFTLIELLVVIAIMAILASLILSALGPARYSAQKTQARIEMKAIETAIQAYHSAYNRYPTPTNVITADFTFGQPGLGSVTNGYANNNSDLMIILLDEPILCNTNHRSNPQQTPFLNVAKRATSTNSPGLGPDFTYRDPWGNPYIITIDYDYDDLCKDNFYSLPSVSNKNDPNDKDGGYNGLRTYDNKLTYALKGPIMIWSMAGPGNKGTNNPNVAANQDPNNRHLLNWVR